MSALYSKFSRAKSFSSPTSGELVKSFSMIYQLGSEMNRLQNLVQYIDRITEDTHLRPNHVSLLLALCDAWIKSQFQSTYHVSRRRLMRASHIHSIATYHKVIKELQVFGYLKYDPSYHPVKASQIEILVGDVSTTEQPNSRVL